MQNHEFAFGFRLTGDFPFILLPVSGALVFFKSSFNTVFCIAALANRQERC